MRKDLRDHINILEKYSLVRVSDAKNKSESFESFINTEVDRTNRIHDDAYSSTVKNNPQYEDGINESAIVKAMLSIKKSEQSASVMETTESTGELNTRTAAKGLVNDIYQLRENRFKLYELKRANDNQPSIIDEYADVSTEMPEYSSGDD